MRRPAVLAPLSLLVVLQILSCIPASSVLVLPDPADTTTHVVTGRLRVVRTVGDTLIGEGLTLRGDSTWLNKPEGGYAYIPRATILTVERETGEARAGFGLIGGLFVITMIVAIVAGANQVGAALLP